MNSNEIRRRFLKYFEDRGHTHREEFLPDSG